MQTTVKYKKDGTPKIKPSGRPKGAISLVEIDFAELKALFNDGDKVVVGNLFLQGAKKAKAERETPKKIDGVTFVT